MQRKFLFLLASLLLLPWRLAGADAVSPLAEAVEYDTHDGYFVSNRFEAEAVTSFAVLKDQASFDQVFGVAMVMRDKSHRLPAGAFDRKIVVTAIHRGKAMVTYKVDGVVAEGGTLVVRYATQVKPDATAEFACPLIISVAKADYQAVRFLENGKQVKRLEVVAKLVRPADKTKQVPLH